MANINFNQMPPQQYIKIVKEQAIRPRFRLSLLYPDESFREDISEYLIQGSGSLQIQYAQGQRRSLNFTLNNESGVFTPNGINSKIWVNTKFQLDLGMEMANGDVVWNSAGIFVIGTPQITREDARKIIDIQCYDKFALLDGTLGGTLDATYEIDAGEKIYNIIVDTLLQDNGNGVPIDLKTIFFDPSLINESTVYTLSKSANESYGDMLIELANMIACDIYYNTNGNLVIQSGIKDISQVNKPTLWIFKDTEYEYLSGHINYDFTDVRNRVTVVGANVNSDGGLYIAVSENTNPRSQTRVDLIGIKNYYLEDSNIYTQTLAQDRADYELNKLSIVQQTVQISSAFMIHLDVNNCIAITDDFFNYFDNRFIIQSISIPLSIHSNMTIDCTNIATLPYYPS
jgi:hypothetical protein|nr:MAG TPA: tail protein [Caudoviricetes sp.]